VWRKGAEKFQLFGHGRYLEGCAVFAVMQSEILRDYCGRVSGALCRTSIMECDLEIYW
jgi:hypothetical protein